MHNILTVLYYRVISNPWYKKPCDISSDPPASLRVIGKFLIGLVIHTVSYIVIDDQSRPQQPHHVVHIDSQQALIETK